MKRQSKPKDTTTPIKPGDRIHDVYGEIRCMAVAEGWVMVRRKGCMPGILNENEWRLAREQEGQGDS